MLNVFRAFSTVIFLFSQQVFSANINVSTAEQLFNAFKNANSNDHIVMINDINMDSFTKDLLRLNDDEKDYITFRSDENGPYKLSGEVHLVIKSDYTTIDNIMFEDAIHKRTNGSDANLIDVYSSHNKIQNCKFIRSGGTHKFDGVITLFGEDNTVQNNVFNNIHSMGVKLDLNTNWGTPVNNKIMNNNFKNITNIDYDNNVITNGKEAIQVKAGEDFSIDLGTIVRKNLFHNVNSDTELISVKSSGNSINHNVALKSDGAITLRRGQNNEVYRNTLIETRRGIVVHDKNNSIQKNIILNPRNTGTNNVCTVPNDPKCSIGIYLNYGRENCGVTDKDVADNNNIYLNLILGAKNGIMVSSQFDYSILENCDSEGNGTNTQLTSTKDNTIRQNYIFSHKADAAAFWWDNKSNSGLGALPEQLTINEVYNNRILNPMSVNLADLINTGYSSYDYSFVDESGNTDVKTLTNLIYQSVDELDQDLTLFGSDRRRGPSQTEVETYLETLP